MSRWPHGWRYVAPVTARVSFPRESALCVKCGRLNRFMLARLAVFHTSNMSAAPSATRFSTLKVTDDFAEQGEGLTPSPTADHQDGDGTADPVDLTEGGPQQSKPIKRPFCKRCEKAALLCICHHVKTLVENKTSIIILQHPEEKKHHLGSARIALLALQNVEIIIIPETDDQVSHRMREKVPGSKRSIAGRGGKKNAPNVKKDLMRKNLRPESHSEQQVGGQQSPNLSRGEENPLELKCSLRAQDNGVTISGENHPLIPSSAVPPSWIRLQPDAGLLFPSQKAVELWPAGLGLTLTSDSALAFQSVDGDGERVSGNSPSQLIVLDGTWNKAKRMFHQIPWLQSLPHYTLPTLQGSRYGRLRREPKHGFLSTVESIVYALQLLEPETQGLESLLDVFDSMLEDQMQFVTDNIRRRYQALE